MIFSKSTEIGICILFCAISAFAQPDTKFDKLRGFAYNPHRTLLGTAPTIGDLVIKPNMIYGNKFVYILPTDYLGYAGFDMLGGSALLGFDDRLILGYARSTWGLSLDISIHKNFTGPDRYNYDEISDNPENTIGLNLSVPLGNYIFYTGASLATRDNYASSNGSEAPKHVTKNASIGITGGKNFIWDLSFAFSRSEINQNYEHANYSNVITNVFLTYNIGYKVLQNNRARLIVGLNNGFIWSYNDDIPKYYYNYAESEANESNSYYLHLNISPNVFGEVALTNNLFAFVGATHSFYINDYDGHYLIIENSDSDAYVGLRYGREHWAIETRLQNDIYESIKNKVNPLINLGGFIYF